MITFRSNGKLLLTAEYAVLDGAKALALPTKFGQNLTIKSIKAHKLIWKSIDHKSNVWFEDEFSLDEINSSKISSNNITNRLLQILKTAKELNPDFLNSESGFNITTKLDFPENWGLGTSSTLINNVANWAKVDAYKLLALTFGGSGYDIACATHNNAITYTLNKEGSSREIEPANFNPTFKDQLFFIHLNKKQNSRDGIKHYNSNKKNLWSSISEINNITDNIISCTTLSEFENLITTHEQIISKLINLPTVKSERFNNFSGAIKSLGAWGGDFILVTGNSKSMDYFKQKGFHTIVSYNDMIL